MMAKGKKGGVDRRTGKWNGGEHFLVALSYGWEGPTEKESVKM